MVKTGLSSRRAAAVALFAIAGAFNGSAQVSDQPLSTSAAGATMTTQLVRTGLYLISGDGSNSLLRFSANGLVLVDGQRPGNYAALMSQVRRTSRITDLPVRFLILTDHHEDHAGNNAEFVAAGVRIVAHANVAAHLEGSGTPARAATPPNMTFDDDHTIRLGGIDVRLLHFGNAHTDADTVVYFPNLRVVALGHLLSGTPDPDFHAGGSLAAWGTVLSKVLKLDFDVAVPGSGPMMTRADVEAFRTKLDTLMVRAKALRASGVAKNQLLALLKTDDLGWRLSFAGEPLDRFYAELSGAK
jgi:glyoxylase-like metal-dependent hydrolase (beta-lactamase superfamily II)